MSSTFLKLPRRSRSATWLASLLAVSVLSDPAFAGYTSVDIQPLINANIQTYTAGNNYPSGGTTLTNEAVTFDLAYYNVTGQTGTGVIQAPSGTSSFDISVSIANPGVVYTLINSAYGSYGDTVGSIEFKATGGLDYTVNLVEGQNIRDHHNDGYNNTIGNGALGSDYVH